MIRFVDHHLRRTSHVVGSGMHFYNHRRPRQVLKMKTPAEARASAA